MSHVPRAGFCILCYQSSPKKKRKITNCLPCCTAPPPGQGCREISDGNEDLPPTWLYMTVWIAGVAVYLNGLTGDFVHDDISAIKTNPDVLGTNHVSRVFFNDYWGKSMADPSSHKSYRPFTILTFRMNHSIFGLHPLGFHIVNVVLHSCVCLLLTRVLLRLLHLSQGTVLSAGLIFATHPIHTESVTGLVGRADVLAAISFLTAILTYHRAMEANSDSLRYSYKGRRRKRSLGGGEGCLGGGSERVEDVGGGRGGGGGVDEFDARGGAIHGDCDRCGSCGSSDVERDVEPDNSGCVSHRCSSNWQAVGGGGGGGGGGVCLMSEGEVRRGRRREWRSRNTGVGVGVGGSIVGCCCGDPKDSCEIREGHPREDPTEERQEEEDEKEEDGERRRRRRRMRKCFGWNENGRLWLGLTGLVAGAGTLCKELALTTLAVCAAWDAICHRKHLRKIFSKQPPDKDTEAFLRRSLSLCLMGSSILVFRLWMLQGSSPAFSDQDNPAAFSSSILTRTLTFLYLPAFNVWLLINPWRLSHDWQMGSIPLITSASDLRNLASLSFYVSIIFIFRRGCLVKGELGRAVLLSLALMVLPFLPATNLFFTVGFVVAERILYIPSLGWSVLVSLGASRSGRLRAPFLLLLLAFFSCRTVLRNRDWESRSSLFSAGLRVLPHNAKMHYNYANLQKDLGNPVLARHHYREAIKLWPGHSSAHNNLGTLLNDSVEAETHFRLALKTHPRHARAYYNLASLKQQQGHKEEAVSLLEESLRHDATNKDAVWALAGLYRDAGRRADAETLHLTLLGARPTDPVVHNNYAAFLHTIGRGEAALRHYEAAIGLDPQHTVALVNTARLMRALQLNTQAELLYKRALAISWDADVGESLGKLYLNTGRLEDAGDVFATVIRHNPEMLSSRVYLARVKLHQRSYLESEGLLQEVLEQAPHHQEALFQLSLLYTHTNRTHDALALANRAAHNCSTPATFCAHLYAHYGDLLKDSHNIDHAVESYVVAVQLEPSLMHVHVNLGALYHTKGDYSRAWQHYLKAHSQDPSNALLLENMEKLRRLQDLQPQAALPRCLDNS